jgi:hypothetical protein
MDAKQTRTIVMAGLVTMVLAWIVVIPLGFKGQPGALQLACSIFAPPAIGIVGSFLAAVAVAGAEPGQSH